MSFGRIALVAGVLALGTGCGTTSSPVASTGVAPVHDSVVHGHLAGVGGPAPGAPRSWVGTVSWSGSASGTVHTDRHGGFELSLPPGHYVLTGHSPQYGDGDYPCQAAHPVVVRTQGPRQVDVLCQMR